MYKLKPEIEFNKMFKIVSKCKKSVFFQTENGDKINLKSIFSRFVFITFAVKKENIGNGYIVCDQEDALLLSDFIGLNE